MRQGEVSSGNEEGSNTVMCYCVVSLRSVPLFLRYMLILYSTLLYDALSTLSNRADPITVM